MEEAIEVRLYICVLVFIDIPQLGDYWKAQAAAQGGSFQTDVMESISKSALDVIGAAGECDTFLMREVPAERTKVSIISSTL